MKKRLFCIFVFLLLITVSLSASGSIEQFINDKDKINYRNNPAIINLLVRIDATEEISSLPKDMEIVGIRPNEWIDIIIPEYRLIDLMKADLDYNVLIWDLNSYMQSFKGEYHTLAEVESILEDIADNYPTITSLYSIGSTYEDRDIWCLEITDNPGEDEGEPGIFFMGLHHAREWPTIEICLYIANELTSKYSSDPDITDIVDNCRLWLVACVNPDGYYYCHDQGYDWRKNRHYFPEYGTYGVDLNRNYGGSSNGDAWGSWGSVGEASVYHHPDESLYCGPGPISELETQAICNIILNNDICAAITWHTYGELVLWPWAYAKYEQTPDNSYLQDIGQQIASKITRQSGSGTYTPKQGSLLYPTTGDLTDWTYGFGHYNIGRPIFAYTIEACSTFHPPEGTLDQIVQENFDGALYLLQEAENIRDTVVPRVIPPQVDEMSIDNDGDYTVSWVEQNPNAEPDYFQLDELTHLSLLTDDVESGGDSWTLDGFSISTSKSHSASHSFKSRYKHQDVSSMTSVNPIPITDELNLSFWCWYNIEEDWDYAFVEISKDGRCYDILDKYTGTSNGWISKEYTLEEYVNESIFIRFRYTTDPNTMEEGFYVDDISPLANYSVITTISDSINDNFFEITNRDEGMYYYRVRGYNLEHEWGDFSTLESVHVIKGYNNPPEIPTFNGPTNGKVRKEQAYTVSTVDPENNDVYFYIDWGDQTNTGWIGPYSSNKEVIANHSWSEKGNYTIKAKAKDIHDAETDWTTLEVTMPKNKTPISSFLTTFFENHPFLFLLIKLLLKIIN